MSTPTSPVRPPKGGTAEARPVGETIAALRRGHVAAADVVGLSDLDRRAAAELAAAWPGLDERTRIATVRLMESLGEERLDVDFGRALRVALADDSPVVRQLAVAALWEDNGGDLLDRLLGLVETDPNQDVRAEAAKGLGRYAERGAAGDLGAVDAAALRATLARLAADGSQPSAVRRRALEAVGAYGQEGPIRDLIREAFEGDDEGMQASALYAMGASLDRRWLNVLLAATRSPDAEIRYEAARACGAMGDEGAVPELAELCADEDVEVRHAAIAALGMVGGRAAVRALRVLSGAEETRESDAELIDAALDEAESSVEPLRVGS